MVCPTGWDGVVTGGNVTGKSVMGQLEHGFNDAEAPRRSPLPRGLGPRHQISFSGFGVHRKRIVFLNNKPLARRLAIYVCDPHYSVQLGSIYKRNIPTATSPC